MIALEKLLPIYEIAKDLGLSSEDIYAYGPYKAKLPLDLLKAASPKKGQLILVSATSPTPAGEGKTTTAIGLVDALKAAGHSACVALREPSMGPTFGLKGGACGGGMATIEPETDINLHFTGDFAAITQANNLIAACLDNHIYWGNKLQIDPKRILFRRALDLNERSLRNFKYVIKQDKSVENAETFDITGHFNITAASELMAIFGLASDMSDLKERLNNVLLAYNTQDEPVYLRSLGITNALLLILKDAFNPNLVQTANHTPAIVHGGAFANIANGTNSLVATKLARTLADYVVTEAGFGADLGLEKYFDLYAGPNKMEVSCVVLVTSLRALKYQAGINVNDLKNENLAAIEVGLANLQRHIKIVESFHVPFVICLNKFADDSVNEIAYLNSKILEQGYKLAVANIYANGAAGGKQLAAQVLEQINCQKTAEAKMLFKEDEDIMVKLNTIATKIYGASAVELSEQAEKDLADIRQHAWQNMPLCIAKTPLSFSDQSTALNAPKNFTLHITSLQPYCGANFIVARCGNILTMPGLPKNPAACHMHFS